jgi:hypothetical protein
VRSRTPNSMALFDFGTDCAAQPAPPARCNQMAYGSLAPPLYNLSAITVPLALYSGAPPRHRSAQRILRPMRRA